MFNKMTCTLGEGAVHHERVVGPVEIFRRCGGNGERHPLAAPLRIFGGGQPFTFIEQIKYALERRRRGDLAVFKSAACLIPFLVYGQQLFNCQIFCLFNHHLYGFFVKVGVIVVQFCKGMRLKDFVNDKINVPLVGN